MSKWSKSLFRLFAWSLLLAALLIPKDALSQEKSVLENRRSQLQKQIRETEKLINRTKSVREKTLLGYKTIEGQLSNRTKLVVAIQQEVKVLSGSISRLEDHIEEQELHINDLQNKYAETLRNAYRIKKSQHPMMYILSAESMNQAMSRWNYLRQLDRYQTNQQKQLRLGQDSLRMILTATNLQKEEKLDLQILELAQKKEMESELTAQKSMLAELQKKESTLKKDLNQKRAETKKLNVEIERIIKAELANTDDAGSLPNAPAMVAMSNLFAENKGKLPWPISKGIITGKFGEQPHPVLKSIKIQNNGVDMSAESGATVIAVFQGEVVGIKNIPGFDNMVILRHGKYYTVYSKLAEVWISKGDQLSTGDSIGRLSASTEGVKEFHFEVWSDKTQVNPEIWLTR